MNNWKAYGKNIEIIPESKNKIIGDTSRYYLYGDVLSVGDLVGTWKFLWLTFKKKNCIKIGDKIGYTLWGLTEILNADGSKQFFIQDNSDFILAVHKKNDI